MAAASPLVCEVDEVTGALLESPELRAQALQAFRALIASTQATKPFRLVREDDTFLLAFLRVRKYELPRALVVLQTFCAFWEGNAVMLEGLSIPDIRATYELAMVQCLDTKDIHGNTVQTIDMGKMDYSKFTPAEMARMAFLLGLNIFDDEQLQTHGVTYCETLAGFSMVKAMMTVKKQSDPQHAKLLQFGLDTMPMRIRNLLVVHQPAWFSWFWALIKFFFKKKLRDRLVLLGTDLARLHAVVPAAGLPPAFGGTLSEPPGAYLDRLEAKVAAAGGMMGGFMIPLQVADPTGAQRRAAAAAAGAAEPAAAAAPAAAAGGGSSAGAGAEAAAGAEAPPAAEHPPSEFSIE